jgi:hypothetical protein
MRGVSSLTDVARESCPVTGGASGDDSQAIAGRAWQRVLARRRFRTRLQQILERNVRNNPKPPILFQQEFIKISLTDFAPRRYAINKA